MCKVGDRARSLRQQAAGAADPSTPPRAGQPTKQSTKKSSASFADMEQDLRPDGRPSDDEMQQSGHAANSANITLSHTTQSNSVHSVNTAQQSGKQGANNKTNSTTFQKVNSTYVKSDYASHGLPDIGDDDAFEAAGTMDISAISKLILTASSTTGSEDLAELIMKVSKSSSASTDRDGSTSSQQKTETSPLRKDSKQTSHHSKGFDRQPDGKPQTTETKKVNPAKSLPKSSYSGSAENLNRSTENLASKIPQRGSKSKPEDRDSFSRKSAEGKAEEDSNSSFNKKFKGSKIPTYGGRRHAAKSIGSDRYTGHSGSELDVSGHDDDDKIKEGKKDGKLPVGKVEPMPSFERDDFNQEQSKWKSPRPSSVVSRKPKEDHLPLPRMDLTSVTGEESDVRIIDGLSTSQHEQLQLTNQVLKSHTNPKSTEVSNERVNQEVKDLKDVTDNTGCVRSDYVSPKVSETNGQVTPNEYPPISTVKTRFSSTPMNPGATYNMTIASSAGSKSHISPSPKDRMTYLPSSADLTLVTPEDSKTTVEAVQKPKLPPSSYSSDNLHYQSTPKSTKTRHIGPRAMHTEDLSKVRNVEQELKDIHAAKNVTASKERPPNPLNTWKPEHSTNISLPNTAQSRSTNVTSVPTLLTSQSLSKTAFASQYLSASGTRPVHATHSGFSTVPTAESTRDFNSSPYPTGGRLSNLTPVSAISSSRLSVSAVSSPMEQYSSLSSYHMSPNTYATLSYGTLLTTGMSALAEPSDYSRMYGQATELVGRLPFGDSTRSGNVLLC